MDSENDVDNVPINSKLCYISFLVIYSHGNLKEQLEIKYTIDPRYDVPLYIAHSDVSLFFCVSRKVS